ncbi:MAG: hypothetical protein Q8P53_01260, partial [Candidatus Shapirobacteria bacterium]|nr:hypothetical protein [Candidatus Shapirobacteria bacterium]
GTNTGTCDGSDTCTGSTATGTCGTTCPGTKSPDYGSCTAAATCEGSSCPTTNSCGGALAGTNTGTCDDTIAATKCYDDTFTGTCSKTCYGSIASSDGSPVGCGSSNNGVFSSPPTTNLCANGSTPTVTYSSLSRTYSWTCAGTNGICGGSSGQGTACSAIGNQEPTFSSLLLKNSSDSIVPAENVVIGGVSTSINQICQTDFAADRTVKFVVQASDLDGASDITKIQLRLGATVYNPSDSISNGQATFNVLFPENTPKTTYNIEVLIDDSYLPTNTTWVDTGRDLKIWNCQVPVSGTLYDNSVGQMFSVVGDSKMNFNALSYDVISPSASYAMTTSNNPTTYTSGANNLVWGTVGMLPTFNNDQLVGGKNDLAVTDMWMRTIDLGTGATNSPVITFQFDVDNNLVSPYSDSPALRIDYSAVVDQASWFQVIAGGVVAKNIVTDNIPVTCDSDPACHAAITIGSNDSIDQNNGLVSAPTISGCGSDNKCEYGIPNNLSLTANVLRENYGYKYFYEGYHAKYGLGKTYSTDTSMSQIISDVGGTGVVFVNGNLTINDNNSLSTNEFLMVVVSGVIMVNSDVNNMAGYFVSDGSIIANNTSSNNLTVDGLLYSSNSNVTLSRSYTEKSDNNNKPAVIINYRPDLLFSMPSRLSKILSGWAEGN